ncbi:MAG: amidohydrolase family protein [Candidatus Aminicenantaceae bacterium]
MKKLNFLLLLCLSLGFCLIFKSKEPPYPSGILFPLEMNQEITYEGNVVTTLQKENGTLYFSTSKGFVYCVDGINRKIIWKYEASIPLASPPYLTKEKIFFYDTDNTIYCLNKQGKLLWTKKNEETIRTGAADDSGNVYFGTGEGSLFALDPFSGKTLWHFRAEGAFKATPVFYRSHIVFGCDDGKIYTLDKKGNLVDQFKTGNKIESTPLVDKSTIYFGSDDNYFYSYNLKKKRLKWKVKTGGKILSKPISDKKRIFFIGWDSVLYSLNRKNGTILWWQTLPSRSFYNLEIIDKRIVASSFSPAVVCFDTATGEKQGEYAAGQEVRSNPLWLDHHLLITIYDPQKDKGKLWFLKKAVKVDLNASKSSPLEIGEEVTFSASAVGFFQPEYEFYLKIGFFKPVFGLFLQMEKRGKIVQEISEEDSWYWFPEKYGDYFVGVRAVDKKQEAETDIPFSIRLTTEEPDLIIFNGKIRTMTEKNPWVEALAIAKDRIIFAGKNDEVLELKTDKTVMINAGENFVMPGFNDSRIQMLRGGLSLLGKEIKEKTELEKVSNRNVKRALLAALSELCKAGITTIQDDSPPFVLRAYEEFLEEGRMKARVILSYDLKGDVKKAQAFRRKFKKENIMYIKFGNLLGDLDGDVAEGKAALIESYSNDPKNKGSLIISPEELREKMKEIEKRRFQLALRASGDRAIRLVLTEIEEALKGEARENTRHRIEKIQLINPSDLEKFGRLGIVAVGCPFELVGIRRGAEQQLGANRAKNMFPWKSLLDKKADLAFSSNWPENPVNPLLGIYASLTRESLDGNPAGGWFPSEKISLDQALAAYTEAASKACFEESIKGTLEKDRLADIIILSKNLYEIHANEVLQTEVIMTLLGGKIVHLKLGYGIQVYDPEVIKIINVLFFILNFRTIQI